MHPPRHHRRGISLLEVLIAIGILSIGLISVLALIPAGKSQASKATAIDRAALLAMNAAADFMNRGFARPSGWTSIPSVGANFVVFDSLGSASFWTSTVSVTAITPRTDAATTATGTAGIASAGTAVADLLVRSEDDIRYSIDGLDEDASPVPQWSIKPYPKWPVADGSGRHVYDGAYSYLATLAGTSGTWNPGEYKTLTVVALSRRDTSLAPVTLSPTTSPNADGSWTVNRSNVPDGTSLKDLLKPGSMILSTVSGQTPEWRRVLLVSDMTDNASPETWKVGLTCEQSDPSASTVTNRVYVFPGAVGSTQLVVKLEGTSAWNDK